MEERGAICSGPHGENGTLTAADLTLGMGEWGADCGRRSSENGGTPVSVVVMASYTHLFNVSGWHKALAIIEFHLPPILVGGVEQS